MKEENFCKPDPPQSDSDLLLLISWKEENYIKAEQAFNLFTRRYSPYLDSVAFRVCHYSQHYYSASLSRQVVWNTFYYVWENPEVVLEALDKKSDQFVDDTSVKAALGRIASKVFRNEILMAEKMFGKEGKAIPFDGKIENKLGVDQEMMPEKVDDRPDDSDFEPGDELIIYEKAMSMLKPREQDIIKMYMQFSVKGQHVSDEVIKILCERWEILPANLKQIRKRALDKLKKYSDELRPLLSKEIAARLK
jgi:hypothetical protein